MARARPHRRANQVALVMNQPTLLSVLVLALCCSLMRFTPCEATRSLVRAPPTDRRHAATTAAASLSTVTVNSAFGPVKGSIAEQAITFKGVPFSNNPGRFELALLPNKTSTIVNALEDGPGCPQNCTFFPGPWCPTTTAENCLWLNIFVPRGALPPPPPSKRLNPASTSTAPLKPVIVVLPNTQFQEGFAGGPLLDMSRFVNASDTIVVVVNARIGALGFAASTDDTSIVGNLGLLDQRIALEYVSKGIASYGGDPKRVTLFGHATGALSAVAHLSMPASEGLFHAVVLDAMPLALPFRNVSSMSQFVRVLAYYSNCKPDSTLGACLKKLTAAQIVEAQQKAQVNITTTDVSDILQSFLPWTPTVDGVVLDVEPLTALQTAQTSPIPIMAGSTLNASTMLVYTEFPEPVSSVLYSSVVQDVYSSQLAPAILQQYPPPNGATDVRPLASEVARDSLCACPTRNGTMHVLSQSSVFLYDFVHIPSFAKTLWPSYKACQSAVCLGSTLPYFFPVNETAAGIKYSTAEAALSKAMVTYLTNFVTMLNPGSASQVVWGEFNATSMNTMVLNTPAPALQGSRFAKRCQLWDNIGYDFP